MTTFEPSCVMFPAQALQTPLNQLWRIECSVSFPDFFKTLTFCDEQRVDYCGCLPFSTTIKKYQHQSRNGLIGFIQFQLQNRLPEICIAEASVTLEADKFKTSYLLLAIAEDTIVSRQTSLPLYFSNLGIHMLMAPSDYAVKSSITLKISFAIRMRYMLQAYLQCQASWTHVGLFDRFEWHDRHTDVIAFLAADEHYKLVDRIYEHSTRVRYSSPLFRECVPRIMKTKIVLLLPGDYESISDVATCIMRGPSACNLMSNASGIRRLAKHLQMETLETLALYWLTCTAAPESNAEVLEHASLQHWRLRVTARLGINDQETLNEYLRKHHIL